MSRLRLPQSETVKAFGGRPCYAALLDLHNGSPRDVRLEVRTGDAEAWQIVVPSVLPGHSWASQRQTPLWIPRVASLRVVTNLDDVVVLERSPWGDGGHLEVEKTP